jgi:hypothetical protein
MALCAGWPIGLDADAEIIDYIPLADAHGLVMAGYQDLLTLPVPVGGSHNLPGFVRMAF